MRISSRQLLIGHQWIRIFEKREMILGGENDDYVTRENEFTQYLSVRFSRLDKSGDTIYIWENYPVPTLYQATLKGRLEL